MFPAAPRSREEMASRGWRVVLMTDARGRRYAENFPAERIEDVAAASPTLHPLKAIPAALKIFRGISQAKKRFAELQPSLVAGFGGYPAFLRCGPGNSARIPMLIHEQNAVLGRVNRAMTKDVAIVACGFDRLDKIAG